MRSSSSEFAATACPFLSRNIGGFSYSPSLVADSMALRIASVSAATSAADAFFGGSDTDAVFTTPSSVIFTAEMPVSASTSSMVIGSTSAEAFAGFAFALFLPNSPLSFFGAGSSLTVGSSEAADFFANAGSSSSGISIARRRAFLVFSASCCIRSFSSVAVSIGSSPNRSVIFSLVASPNARSSTVMGSLRFLSMRT